MYTLLWRRASLPSEALEEFLSILRPTFFSPTSPILRARLHGSTLSLPNIPCDRPYPFKNRGLLDVVHPKPDTNGSIEMEDAEVSSSTRDNRSSSTPESVGGTEF